MLSNTITIDSVLRQSDIWRTRYELSRDSISTELHEQLIRELHNTLGLTYVDVPTYTKGQPVKICEWMNHFAYMEPHLYDFDIPQGYTTPISFFDNGPWVIMLFAYDGYAIMPPSPLNQPTYITKIYAGKNEMYMPKTMRIENIELGWIGYDDSPDCIMIHHNQVHGALKGYLSPNNLLWMYRYMIRTSIQRLPRDRHHQIFVPDAHSYALFMERKMKYTQIPMTAYTKHVLQKSDFTKVSADVFEQACPIAASQCDMFNYLDRTEIKFWRYEYDNPSSLANTCNGAR